jgi:hypothetical protein
MQESSILQHSSVNATNKIPAVESIDVMSPCK